MQFEYLLTLDDFAEARKAATPLKKSQRTGNRLLGWVMFAVITAGFTLLLTSHTPTPMATLGPVPQTELPPAQNLWITLTPPLLIAGLLLFSVVVGGIGTRRRARLAIASNSAPSQVPASKLLGYAMLLPFVLLALPVFPIFRIDWSPEPALIEIVAYGPYIALIFIFALLGRFTRRTADIQHFAQQRGARRKIQLQATADNVTVDDGLNFYRYDWTTFDRYQETKNLVNLITENETLWIIPKRAVPDPADLDALRGLIQTKIPRGTFLPREHRFPVLPAPVLAIDDNDKQSAN